MIQHKPQFPVGKVEKFYSDKDGVPVKYVLSSELTTDDLVYDIYYRNTPHPEFGNKYFGLTRHPTEGYMLICNADWIDGKQIDCIEVDGDCYYSQCRHDYVSVGGKMIDGGRAYTRWSGDKIHSFTVVNGELV